MSILPIEKALELTSVEQIKEQLDARQKARLAKHGSADVPEFKEEEQLFKHMLSHMGLAIASDIPAMQVPKAVDVTAYLLQLESLCRGAKSIFNSLQGYSAIEFVGSAESLEIVKWLKEYDVAGATAGQLAAAMRGKT